jgi:hypothetical protein
MRCLAALSGPCSRGMRPLYHTLCSYFFSSRCIRCARRLVRLKEQSRIASEPGWNTIFGDAVVQPSSALSGPCSRGMRPLYHTLCTYFFSSRCVRCARRLVRLTEQSRIASEPGWNTIFGDAVVQPSSSSDQWIMSRPPRTDFQLAVFSRTHSSAQLRPMSRPSRTLARSRWKLWCCTQAAL